MSSGGDVIRCSPSAHPGPSRRSRSWSTTQPWTCTTTRVCPSHSRRKNCKECKASRNVAFLFAGIHWRVDSGGTRIIGLRTVRTARRCSRCHFEVEHRVMTFIFLGFRSRTTQYGRLYGVLASKLESRVYVVHSSSSSLLGI